MDYALKKPDVYLVTMRQLVGEHARTCWFCVVQGVEWSGSPPVYLVAMRQPIGEHARMRWDVVPPCLPHPCLRPPLSPSTSTITCTYLITLSYHFRLQAG